MVVETGGGFRFGQLSPRRQRERKRARFGCGLADDVLDSPSPSPNPTPLASPFERDEQVVVLQYFPHRCFISRNLPGLHQEL